jgi:hypothetical protein
MKPARILVGTPTANGDLCVEYCETIVQLLQHFGDNRPDVTFDVRFYETFDLRLVRNVYASHVLNDPSFTHLLFFDSDMGFFPSLLEKMLAAGKPVVGVVSPKRSLEQPRVAELARRYKDIRIAEIAANDYIPEKSAYPVGYLEDGETPAYVKHDGSLIPVGRCGTGIMLIHRSVFETMRATFPDDWDAVAPPAARPYGVTGGYLRCFDAVTNAKGTTLGEDYAFSQRWVARLKGEIHLVFDEVIFHVGDRRTIGNAAIRYANRRAGKV